ncbi:MAG: hypothetical protein QGF09_11920 [Rhodospirillales bacterium]|jgi:hypothetical protein|nr:hypothetical protein [Rhodospirillales bacterium]
MEITPEILGEAKAHAMEAIARSELRLEPYPHIYVEDILPGDFFRVLLEHLPETDCYRPFVESGRVSEDYDPRRLVIFHHEDDLGRLPVGLAQFWESFFICFHQDDFARTLFEKFSDQLAYLFQPAPGGEVPTIQLHKEVMLIRDLEGYCLGPHTDTPPKVVTVLFYLPKDESRPDLGTAIYLPKDRDFALCGGEHYSFDEFDHVATQPYVPNRLLSFVCGEQSFHGVEPIKAGQGWRNLILYDLKIV